MREREPEPISLTNKERLRGGRCHVRASGWPRQKLPPFTWIPVDSGPPDAIIADPDGNPIGIHSMA